MKKQSSRARAQSTPPVRHQLEHPVPTVIHDPEEKMTALGRWAHHAMLEPRKYLGWPAAILGGLFLVLMTWNLLSSGGPSTESQAWSKLETAKTPAERVELAKENPSSPASTWALLQAATEYFNQALAELPANRDVAGPTATKAIGLFDQVLSEAPHDSPQARVAALGKARTLELRGELPKAIDEYDRVVKDWPGSSEAESAARYAAALKDPQAAAFYKELYTYTPARMDLPPMATETLPPPGVTSDLGTGATGAGGGTVSPDRLPAVFPDLVEPGSPKAQTKSGSTPAKPATSQPAATTKDLPEDVFAPKAKEPK